MPPAILSLFAEQCKDIDAIKLRRRNGILGRETADSIGKRKISPCYTPGMGNNPGYHTLERVNP
jgi:hypothetical protein